MATSKNNQKQTDAVQLTTTSTIPAQTTVAPPPPAVASPKPMPATPIQLFVRDIEKYEATVLPNLLSKHHIDPAQFKQIVLSEVKKNPKLLQAFVENPSSMFASILAGAEIGLIPSDMLGEFYLIPRNLKQPNGQYKATVTPLIGYKGLVSILMRSGDIMRIHTECVFEGEVFEPVYGLEPNIIHKPNFNLPRTSDKITFVYAVAKLKGGDYNFAVMSKADIINIQKMSKYDNDLYFNDKSDPMRWMIRKTALIQLAKMLPKDYYGKKAIDLDNQLTSGATVLLDEEGNEIKIIDGRAIKPTKHASVVNTLNNLPSLADSIPDSQ